MNKVRKTVGVALSALILTLGAGFATSASASASAATADRVAQAPTQQQDLEWRLVNIYATYDECYWAGFDGWNNYQWDHWRCPQILGAYWLMVAND